MGTCTAGGSNDRSVEMGMSGEVLADACVDAGELDVVTMVVVASCVLDAVAVFEVNDVVFSVINVVVTVGSDKHEHALEIRCDKGVLIAMSTLATSRA